MEKLDVKYKVTTRVKLIAWKCSTQLARNLKKSFEPIRFDSHSSTIVGRQDGDKDHEWVHFISKTVIAKIV